jgi:hypothetical protein
MELFKKIVSQYPLTDQITPDTALFRVLKKRFVLFQETQVDKQNIKAVLDETKSTIDRLNIPGWRTVVVVAPTQDSFESDELFYFDNVNTFVVFYLIDEQKKRVYMNDSWIFALGMNYKKVVRKINEIVKEYFA